MELSVHKAMLTGVEEDCSARACRPPDIREFPPDIFTQEQRFYGGVALHLLICLHIFCALTVVCEDYFVASLNRITACLKMEPDVAGATFMAVGSSAPTLFIAVISIFFTEGDIGLGTIVGSTIFNTLFIISLCGCAASVSLKLMWYPIIRDSTMYTLSVLILIVALYDQQVHWYEGVAFIISYALYIVVMCNNSRLEAWCLRTKDKYVARKDGDEGEEELKEDVAMKAVQDAIHDDEASSHSPLKPPCGTWSRIVWLFTLPSILLFYVTIPDCRQKQWNKFYLVTFTASTLWMGVLSYVLVWMVAIIGYTYNIPECAMGMTFLAAGSSLPDAISSLIVVRQGNADMAVSSCIGSNVFDMLCLGIPWVIKTTVIEPNSSVKIRSENIFFISFILLVSIVVTVLLLFLNKWKLDQKVGVIFLIAYLLFLGVATFIETLPCSPNHASARMVDADRLPRRLGLLHIGHKKGKHFLNCSRHAVIDVLQYETLFTLEERRHGAILFHTCICLYCLGALALLCDHYFCASLEKLCKRLRIPTDVAGATFMAAGSSTPTLFIAIASVFLGEGDIGLGTIIGSTMFNILFITSICGLCSGIVLTLTPWPLVRDSCVYTINLAALLFVIHDNVVCWYEAAIFPVLYSGYIVVMCYNKTLEKGFDALRGKCSASHEDEEGTVQMEDPIEIINEQEKLQRQKMSSAAEQQETSEETEEMTSLETRETAEIGQSSPAKHPEQEEKSTEDAAGHGSASSFIHASPFQAPQGSVRKVFWAIMLPVQALFFISMPDCRQKAWEAWYPVTFVMSIVWMALLSYVLVWTVSIMGETFGIPECIMGLTLLAAGSSVPDAIASLVVAKHGMGDMALANCVGSNIFDILCLGFPWFLATAAIEPGSTVLIHSGHIVYTSLCLFGTVLAAFCAIHLNNWKLDKRLGTVLLFVYFIFLACAVVLEALPSGQTGHGHGPQLSPHHPGHEPHRGLAHGMHHAKLHKHYKMS